MSNRLLILLLALGAIGYGAVWILFPRYDAASQWHYQLDRNQVVAKAQTFAAQQNLDVSNWSMGIIVQRERNHEQYLHDHPTTGLEHTFLSPLKTRLRFRDPRENRAATFVYAANGQLLSYEFTGYKLTEQDKAASPNKLLAEQAVANLIGDAQKQFRFSSDSEPEKGRHQYIWSYSSPSIPDLKFEIESSVAGTTLTRLEIKPSLPPAYREELSRRALAAFAVMGGLEFALNALCVLGALVLYFLCLNRKELDHLSTLIFFVAAWLLMLIGNMGLLNEYQSDTIKISGVNNPTALLLIPYILFGVTTFFLVLLWTTFWATGEATQAKYGTGRLTVFAAVLRAKVFTRAVANNLTAGILFGGLIASIPYVLAWISGFSATPSDYLSRHTTFASSNLLFTSTMSSLFSGEVYYLFLLFAFLLPVLRAYLSSPWVARGLFFFIGTISLIDLNPNQTASLTAKLAVAWIWFGLFTWLYWRFDLLAVLTANFAASLILKACGMRVQDAPILQTAGMRLLFVLGAVTLIALVLSRLAPSTEPEARQLLTANEDKVERERIRAEFNVARKAQENLLPSESPNIPGFGIAALCRPARECGGDLYDFIPIRDGKLGIVVADVSGKGVPAALYMTLTKGLLLSVAENSSDPGEILREVNKHLYEVCKRKTFVTLFFGVLDPVEKTLTYSRAGHNPPVWRRQSEQVTKWLKPAGIGLGLNAGRSFDRVLAVEQIQLSRDDLLIFYSDGITEAMNEQQEEYGEDRLETVAAMTDGMGAEESLSAVFVNVSNFLGKMLPQDDQTLVVVRVS